LDEENDEGEEGVKVIKFSPDTVEERLAKNSKEKEADEEEKRRLMKEEIKGHFDNTEKLLAKHKSAVKEIESQSIKQADRDIDAKNTVLDKIEEQEKEVKRKESLEQIEEEEKNEQRAKEITEAV